MSTNNNTKSFVSKPDDFDGSFGTYQKFLNQTALYVLANPEWFKSDGPKVQLALSYMKDGHAAEFAKNFMEQILKQTTPDFGTWTDFKKLMDSAFLDPNEAKNAQWKLHKCTQGKKTAAEFFTEFDLLRRAAGYDDATTHQNYLLQLLEQALNRSIVNIIIGSGNIPTSYADWRTRALAIDAGQQRIRELKQHSSNPTQSSWTDSA